MVLSNQDNVFKKHYQKKPISNQQDISPVVSWPILLAIIPTLGAFFAGSAEIWSDFIMLILILFYVYKSLTVPWSYYESARSRRMLHQQAEEGRRQHIMAELRRHEFAGLVWVVLSPAIAGYSLQYSRYLLSNVDRYISAFNVTVFILAASIKPLMHIMTLLQERTLFLQSEASLSESQVHLFEAKLELLEQELVRLRKAFATKKDLGQVTEEIQPTLQQLAKALKRFEKRDVALRTWSEEQFTSIDLKVREFDQYILYRIEQERKQQHGMVVSLILLPLNISLWVAKRMTNLLPTQQGKNLLTSSQPLSKTNRFQIPDSTASNYSTEGSLAAFGH